MSSALTVNQLLEIIPYAALARIIACLSAGTTTLDHEASNLSVHHNVMQRAIRTIPHLEEAYLKTRSAGSRGRLAAKETTERKLKSIRARLRRSEITMTDAARQLGVSTRTLYDRFADLRRREELTAVH